MKEQYWHTASKDTNSAKNVQMVIIGWLLSKRHSCQEN